MRAYLLLLLAGLTVATTDCDHRPINATAALPAPGTALPAFEFPRIDATGSVTPSALIGAPTVLALWSTHCPYQGPWIAELDSLAHTYAPRGVRIVVLADDPPGAVLDSALAQAAWRPEVTEIGVANGRLSRIFDRSAAAPERRTDRVEFVLPSFLLTGPDGRVVRRAFGPVVARFRPALDSLLGGAPAESAQRQPRTALPATTGSASAQSGVATEPAVVFATHGGVDLMMDMAYPKTASGPRPVLIFISGSFWGHWWGPRFDRHQYDRAIRAAAEHGYFAATVGYRPISVKENGKTKYRYPAQLIDVRSAVRWLRAHASRYDLDTHRFGAVGWSSGGQLSLMLGLLNDTTRLAGEVDDLSYSSSVEAVVSISGPTDMSRLYAEATYPGEQGLLVELMGGTPEQLPDRYRDASPISYVTRRAPPILMIQGDADIEVPPDQARFVQERMKAVGAPVRVIVVPKRKHYNDIKNPAILKFFDSVLKNR